MAASCHRRSGDYQQAFELYKAVHEAQPSNLECLRYLAHVCEDLGKTAHVHEYAAKLREAELREAERQSAERAGGTAEAAEHTREPHETLSGAGGERFDGARLEQRRGLLDSEREPEGARSSTQRGFEQQAEQQQAEQQVEQQQLSVYEHSQVVAAGDVCPRCSFLLNWPTHPLCPMCRTPFPPYVRNEFSFFAARQGDGSGCRQ